MKDLRDLKDLTMHDLKPKALTLQLRELKPARRRRVQGSGIRVETPLKHGVSTVLKHR